MVFLYHLLIIQTLSGLSPSPQCNQAEIFVGFIGLLRVQRLAPLGLYPEYPPFQGL